MKVLRFIFTATHPYRFYLYGITLAMCYVAFDKNLKPYLIKYLIDTVSAHDYNKVGTIIFIYAIAQIMLTAAWSLADWCGNKSFPLIRRHVSEIFINKIALYPYQFFQDNLAGAISSKISDASRIAPDIIVTIIHEFFQISLFIMISAYLLFNIHYLFGIAMLSWICIFCTFTYFKMRRAALLSQKEAEANSKVWGTIVDYISNIITVRLFTNQSFENKLIQKVYHNLIDKNMQRSEYLRKFLNVQGLIFSCYIIACVYGMVYLHKLKVITTGDFILIFMLNFQIVDWLFTLVNILRKFVTDFGVIGQSIAILGDRKEILDKPNAKALKCLKGEIIFNKVQFYYKDSEPLFQNKSVIIKPGQKVGLVGYSGSGKTTFTNLILRLFDVTSGNITIDKQCIMHVTQDSLRAAIAIIPQDPLLFHRSLMENIRYGNIKATDEEVINAAKKAHAHDFIVESKYGYESLVGERGIKLSRGQRQRIAIARALLKNAPILILDEATSQLDSATEKLIQGSLLDLMQNKTTIVIAHRLSTLLNMDRILVFDKGRIIEDGTHSDLIARNGLYKTLWDAQIGGFLPDKEVNIT